MCVDLITLPSGRFIKIRLDIGNTLMTGVPGRTKYPIVLASSTATSTAIVVLLVVTHVTVLGHSHSLLLTLLLLKREIVTD